MDQEDDTQYYKYLVALSVETVSSRWDLRPQNEVKMLRMVVVSAKKREVVEVLNIKVEEGGLEEGVARVDAFFKGRGLVFPDFVFISESRWPLDSCIKLEAACKQISLREQHWCYFLDLRIEALKAGLNSTDLAGIADGIGAAHDRDKPVDTIANIVVEMLHKNHKFRSPQVVTNTLLSTMQQLWLEGGSEKDDINTAIEEHTAVVLTGIPEAERDALTVEQAQNFMKPLFIPFENIVLRPTDPNSTSLQIYYLTPDKPAWLSALSYYTRSWKDKDIDILPVCLHEVSKAGWKGVPPPRGKPRSAPRPHPNNPYSPYAPYPKTTTTGIAPYVVLMRGVPYTANELEVAEFLHGVDIKYQGIHMVCTTDDKVKGLCYVELNSYQDLMLALERDHRKMGGRTVQVTRCGDDELLQVIHRAVKVGPPFPEIPSLSQQFYPMEECLYGDLYHPSPYSSPYSSYYNGGMSSFASPYSSYSGYLAYVPPGLGKHGQSASSSAREKNVNTKAEASSTVPTSPSEPQATSNQDSSNGSLTS